jgi:hypothetical protein
MPPELPQPWRGFLKDVDAGVRAPTTLHCLGGFVVALQYGMLRPTADVDLLAHCPKAPGTSCWPSPAGGRDSTASTSSISMPSCSASGPLITPTG